MSEATTVKSMLYVVMGETGEYSDRSEWPVRAFIDKTKAQSFVDEADEWLRTNDLHYDSQRVISSSDRRARLLGDSKWRNVIMNCDYTGARLYVMEVELDDEVRQEIAESFVAESGPRAVAVSGKIGGMEG